ncbi:MAG: endopeptidase La [Bradymonadia bacterium]
MESRDAEDFVFPVLPLKSTIIYPHGVTTLQVSTPAGVALIEGCSAPDAELVLAFAKRPEADAVRHADLSRIAIRARILDRLKLPGESLQITLQGLDRVELVKFEQESPFFMAMVSPVPGNNGDPFKVNILVQKALTLYERLTEMSDTHPKELLSVIKTNVDAPERFADLLAGGLEFDYPEKLRVLSAVSIEQRLQRVIELVRRETERVRVAHDVDKRARGDIEESRREYFLRQQMRSIQKELGDGDAGPKEADRYVEQLDALDLPEEIAVEPRREIERLRHIQPSAGEYQIIKTYLDRFFALPWKVLSEEHIELDAVKAILERDHYGLDKVKDRILEFLAVRKLNPDHKGPILCFAGPPGVGKTSLGRSIAEAIGREFFRISVGGVHDEAEIRGHRRTYIGAMPGKILTAITRAGVMNPLIILDEIDKIGSDHRGDPAAALLEVLDPEQNNAFTDHYFNVPFDLSQVLFIVTANYLHDIPRPLLDRLEVITIEGYTENEKVEIARRHLLQSVISDHGLEDAAPTVEDDAIRAIARRWTREAGVRNLQRSLQALARKVARAQVEGGAGDYTPPTITAEQLPDYLGPEKFVREEGMTADEVGVANGLAWTATGGEVLLIEALKLPGAGKLVLTGKLGDVMKESVQAAWSYVRSRADTLKIPEFEPDKLDLHIHFPAGAVPKDGPSAGITICVAIASLLSGRPVRASVAMTGEITLRGKVLPVGGVKDKILAAHRAGVTTVILPKANEKDLVEIPEEIREAITFHPVDHVDEILPVALEGHAASPEVISA